MCVGGERENRLACLCVGGGGGGDAAHDYSCTSWMLRAVCWCVCGVCAGVCVVCVRACTCVYVRASVCVRASHICSSVGTCV